MNELETALAAINRKITELEGEGARIQGEILKHKQVAASIRATMGQVTLSGRAPHGAVEKAILGVLDTKEGRNRAEIIERLKSTGYAYSLKGPHISKFIQKLTDGKLVRTEGKAPRLSYYLKK
jgi:hypothetical protein